MATKPKVAKRSPLTAPRVVSVMGEPIGRFAQVLAETREAGMAIEPFEVTADLILYPPTPERVAALDQYSAAHLLAQTVAVSLVQSQADPPEDPELRAVYAKQCQNELREAYEQVGAAEQSYNEALFGGAEIYQRINEYFAGRPAWQQQAFEKAIKEQFLRLPVDGACQACGTVVDPKAQSSATASSGGSSGTSTISTETSPSTSEASTSVTGGVESDLGASSSPTASALPA